jgi:hypothetical protein
MKMEIELVEGESLNVPDWGATHILRPDLLVLARSIAEHGVLAPLVVQREGSNVIDGAQRLRLCLDNAALNEACEGKVPVVWIDCDNAEAMILHIQINRGRGAVVAHKLSKLIKTLKRVMRMTDAQYKDLFNMKFDELELLLDGSIIKHRKVANHRYSRAWVPVEAPPGTTDSDLAIRRKVAIEKPPNPDR